MTAQQQTFDPVQYKVTTHAQWQDAAEAWARWTPVIQQWLAPVTEAMLELAGIQEGSHVLEVGAGAGDPSITVAGRIGPTGRVLATDSSSNILGFAARAARDRGLSNYETRVMDGESLDVGSEKFDVVMSRLAVIYFPHQLEALSGMLHALKPGGCAVNAVFTTADRNGFFSVPISVVRRRAQLPPPLPGQPGPFSLGTPAVLEDLYKRAGFRDVSTRVVPANLHMNSTAECLRFERESFGALHQMLTGLPEAERDSVWDEIEDQLRQFEGPHGFEAPCELIIGFGRK
jgi:ubiquinone/menaquinone biosynthesis C-methylase UbiE